MKKQPSTTKARSNRKWYSRMSPTELDALVAPVDRPIDVSEMRPLSPAMKKRVSAARRKKPGRPPVGKGAEKLRISMERGLLQKADRYARTHGLSRSELIAQGVRRLIDAA
jgi:hypothetical protein